jgi:hypothetical protein
LTFETVSRRDPRFSGFGLCLLSLCALVSISTWLITFVVIDWPTFTPMQRTGILYGVVAAGIAGIMCLFVFILEWAWHRFARKDAAVPVTQHEMPTEIAHGRRRVSALTQLKPPT